MVIVPKLFPDDVASREAWDKKLAGDQGKVTLAKYRELRDKAGDPGRVSPGKCKVDPTGSFLNSAMTYRSHDVNGGGSAGSAVYGKTLDGGEIEYLSRGTASDRQGRASCLRRQWRGGEPHPGLRWPLPPIRFPCDRRIQHHPRCVRISTLTWYAYSPLTILVQSIVCTLAVHIIGWCRQRGRRL